MRYQAILSLNCNDFTNHTFKAFASTAQAAINKVRKQAVAEGLNVLNSRGQISIYKRRYCEYDENYYHVRTVSAWN
jgi:hypothetical protein